MENILYEKDYSEEHRKQAEDNAGDHIFDYAVESGFFKAYSDSMRKLPKVINPVRKSNFEFLRDICDRMAKRWGGKIRAEVRYDKWDAIIDLTLPFVEFGSPEELNDMMAIAFGADSVTFTSEENGLVRTHIFCYYFDDVATEDERDNALYDALNERPNLLKALLTQMQNEGIDIAEYLDRFPKDEK